MNKIAVIYKSKYGSTKEYASWIAEALDAELFEQSEISGDKLNEYDIVVYGGGLYASGISGIDFVVKNPVQNLVVFIVGLANPETTDYSEILDKNLPQELREKAKVFHLRGGIDYSKLGIVHRGMMAMMKKISIGKKKEDELTDEEKVFLNSYGNAVDFTNRETVKPLIDYVNSEIIGKNKE